MTTTPVDLYICVTCQHNDSRPGVALLKAIGEKQSGERVRLHPVECMSVCTRPCTVAVSSPRKWTYIIGDLNASTAEELMDYVDSYAASEYGTPPLKMRPPAIRKGTIARIPPLTTG